MTNQPFFIDNVAFAKKNEHLAGELSLADCARLNDLLIHSAENSQANTRPSGTINYQLQGKTDAASQQLLDLTISTDLTTTCQRCLNEMPLKLSLTFNYLIGDISDTDIEAGDVDTADDVDMQQASQTMDVVALIEDEIIMAMPIAPIHSEDCGEIITQSGEKPNPFAVLIGLIKS
jgi:uncharacterized protein